MKLRIAKNVKVEEKRVKKLSKDSVGQSQVLYFTILGNDNPIVVVEIPYDRWEIKIKDDGDGQIIEVVDLDL